MFYTVGHYNDPFTGKQTPRTSANYQLTINDLYRRYNNLLGELNEVSSLYTKESNQINQNRYAIIDAERLVTTRTTELKTLQSELAQLTTKHDRLETKKNNAEDNLRAIREVHHTVKKILNELMIEQRVLQGDLAKPEKDFMQIQSQQQLVEKQLKETSNLLNTAKNDVLIQDQEIEQLEKELKLLNEKETELTAQEIEIQKNYTVQLEEFNRAATEQLNSQVQQLLAKVPNRGDSDPFTSLASLLNPSSKDPLNW